MVSVWLSVHLLPTLTRPVINVNHVLICSASTVLHPLLYVLSVSLPICQTMAHVPPVWQATCMWWVAVYHVQVVRLVLSILTTVLLVYLRIYCMHGSVCRPALMLTTKLAPTHLHASHALLTALSARNHSQTQTHRNVHNASPHII